MLIKEESGRINFIDKNDSFVGFYWESWCCERFGYYVADSPTLEDPQEDKPLDGYWFDTSVEPEYVNGSSSYDDGGVLVFKCMNADGSFRYLHLYNHHNGYYGHGWESSWGCEGYL